MYKITYHRRVIKQLNKIPFKKADAINEIIRALSKNPFDSDVFDLKKVEDDPLAFRCRKGNYRIVYVIYKHNKIIDIRRVQHRQEGYRKIFTFFSL